MISVCANSAQAEKMPLDWFDYFETHCIAVLNTTNTSFERKSKKVAVRFDGIVGQFERGTTRDGNRHCHLSLQLKKDRQFDRLDVWPSRPDWKPIPICELVGETQFGRFGSANRNPKGLQIVVSAVTANLLGSDLPDRILLIAGEVQNLPKAEGCIGS